MLILQIQDQLSKVNGSCIKDPYRQSLVHMEVPLMGREVQVEFEKPPCPIPRFGVLTMFDLFVPKQFGMFVFLDRTLFGATNDMENVHCRYAGQQYPVCNRLRNPDSDSHVKPSLRLQEIV